MTENLLQKLEKEMMLVLTEIEKLRHENQLLTQENNDLKVDKEQYLQERKHNEEKLQDILSLFDAIKPVESIVNQNVALPKPVLVQG